MSGCFGYCLIISSLAEDYLGIYMMAVIMSSSNYILISDHGEMIFVDRSDRKYCSVWEIGV